MAYQPFPKERLESLIDTTEEGLIESKIISKKLDCLSVDNESIDRDDLDNTEQ